MSEHESDATVRGRILEVVVALGPEDLRELERLAIDIVCRRELDSAAAEGRAPRAICDIPGLGVGQGVTA